MDVVRFYDAPEPWMHTLSPTSLKLCAQGDLSRCDEWIRRATSLACVQPKTNFTTPDGVLIPNMVAMIASQMRKHSNFATLIKAVAALILPPPRRQLLSAQDIVPASRSSPLASIQGGMLGSTPSTPGSESVSTTVEHMVRNMNTWMTDWMTQVGGEPNAFAAVPSTTSPIPRFGRKLSLFDDINAPLSQFGQMRSVGGGSIGGLGQMNKADKEKLSKEIDDFLLTHTRLTDAQRIFFRRGMDQVGSYATDLGTQILFALPPERQSLFFKSLSNYDSLIEFLSYFQGTPTWKGIRNSLRPSKADQAILLKFLALDSEQTARSAAEVLFSVIPSESLGHLERESFLLAAVDLRPITRAAAVAFSGLNE